MTNNYQEPLSALLDDELSERDLHDALSSAEVDVEAKEQFSRYALIGDVMRNEQELIVENSFAASIQEAVANIELPTAETASEQTPEVERPAKVTEISSHPKWRERFNTFVTQIGDSAAAKSGAQFAIAASVALVAVVGVGNMQTSQTERVSSPVLNTVPIVQDLKPVSLDGTQKKPTANQVTQSRINALMADHNQQVRAAEEQSEEKSDASSEIDGQEPIQN